MEKGLSRTFNFCYLVAIYTCTGFDTRAFQVNGTIQVGKDYEDGKAIAPEFRGARR